MYGWHGQNLVENPCIALIPNFRQVIMMSLSCKGIRGQSACCNGVCLRASGRLDQCSVGFDVSLMSSEVPINLRSHFVNLIKRGVDSANQDER